MFKPKIEGAGWLSFGSKEFKFGWIVSLDFILMRWLVEVVKKLGDLQVFTVNWIPMIEWRLGICYVCCILNLTYFGYAWVISVKFFFLKRSEGGECSHIVRCKLSGMF